MCTKKATLTILDENHFSVLAKKLKKTELTKHTIRITATFGCQQNDFLIFVNLINAVYKVSAV